jgi:2-keto-4-pentenoate hydratase/2-oxohepta-3-ene-1,7-dioic acid hydratase in catechol pathway
MSWTKLIRFIAVDGKTTFGDAIADDASEVPQKLEQNELYALELEGSDPFALVATGKKVQVKTLLAILTPSDVPVIRCIGLNYIKHSKLFWSCWNRPTLGSDINFVPVKEGGRTPPPYPSLFVKPRTSIASYNEDIPIPKITQENQLDYEGELVRIIPNNLPGFYLTEASGRCH